VFVRRRSSQTLRRRPYVAAVTLAAISLCSMGIPVVPLATKDLSTPFPCQNHPCGCHDAEYCWRHCGCHTVAEKLAWARAHNVTPPSHFMQRVATSGILESSRERDRQEKTRPPCCCLPTPSPCCEVAKDESGSERPRKTSVILISAYRTCRGLDTCFAGCTAVICEPSPDPWRPEPACFGNVVVVDPAFYSIRSAPPSPPPRSRSLSATI